MTDPRFLLSTMMLGIVMLSNIMFGLIGAPMVKHVLGLGPHTVGTLSLMIGGGYLLGNLTNRAFVSKKEPLNLVLCGIIMYGLSLLPMLLFSSLNLFVLAVAMIFFISYSTGFIFPNILARCLTLHKENISFAAAAQGAMMLSFVSIGSYLVSLFTLETPVAMWGAFFTLFILISIIFAIFKKITVAE
jgi:predicted MFS family arabinose efflux permease